MHINKEIVHIVTKEKFSVGYINFMKKNMKEYQHYFFLVDKTNDKYHEYELMDTYNIYYFKDNLSLLFDKNIRQKLDAAYKIIVTGLFGQQIGMVLWPKRYMSKTYVHLWGGDFYYLRNKGKDLFDKIYRISEYIVFKRVKGIIFLFKEEEEPFKKITKIIPQNTFEAPMMGDPFKKDLLLSFDNNTVNNSVKKVIVGNSADPTNNHSEALDKLKEIDDGKILIICPLSYGSKVYAQKVISKGKEYFHNRFIAVTQWMSFDDYLKWLKACDVGVFFNDRQQALGMINSMLYMGKKVFLKSDTSMYTFMVNNNCAILKDTDLNIENITSELDTNEKERNRKYVERLRSQDSIIEKWKCIFEQV